VVDLASANPTNLLWGAGQLGSDLIANGIYVGFQTNDTFLGGQAQFLRLLDTTAGMGPTSVNDMFVDPDRLPAPVIASLSNRVVTVSNTLAFTVQVTADPADTVVLTAQSDLAPNHWTFTAPNQFSFTPAANETGVHTFLFTATGEDGFDEELITITVTSQSEPTGYQQWATAAGLDLEGPNAGPSDDFDSDGRTNEEEFWADTDPTDPDSFLQIQAITLTDTGLNISMDKASDNAPRAYVVHTASQLVGNGWEWSVLGTNQSATGVLPVTNLAPPVLIFKVTIPAAP
jgi:hypothetical protein